MHFYVDFGFSFGHISFKKHLTKPLLNPTLGANPALLGRTHRVDLCPVFWRPISVLSYDISINLTCGLLLVVAAEEDDIIAGILGPSYYPVVVDWGPP